MAISNETVKELAVLANGRNPVYTTQGAYELDALPGPPGTVSLGLEMGNTLNCLVDVIRRRNPAYRSAWVTVTGVDIGQVYTVTIGATDYDYTALSGDEEQEILDGLATALAGASATVDVVVETVASIPTLKITGVAAADYDVEVSTDGGTAELTLSADATLCSFRVWTLPKDETDPMYWCVINEGLWVDKDVNWRERIAHAGIGKVYIEPTETDGRVVVRVAPCELE